MKNKVIILLFLLSTTGLNITAQQSGSSEKYGKTLNLGVGVGGNYGYYGHVGHPTPVFVANFEFDIVDHLTLAPFVNIYSNNDDNYHEIVIPTGVKCTYYFDKLLKANPDWDFYLAGSLGFAIIISKWDEDYHGNKDYYEKPPSLFIDMHAGAEYHFNSQLGVFADLSLGVLSTGLAIHFAK